MRRGVVVIVGVVVAMLVSGCGTDWSGRSAVGLVVDDDGGESLVVAVERCGDDGARLLAREREEEVILSVEAEWDDTRGCRFVDQIALEEPLADRSVYLAGPALRFRRCADVEERAITATLADGPEALCTDGDEQPVGIPDLDFNLDLIESPEQ